MKWIINIFIIVLFAIDSAKAQNPLERKTVRFHHIGIKDGLSSRTINTIFEDRYGFIWIGTANDLNLYYRHSFKDYSNNPDDSTSLIDNLVTDIVQGQPGKLLVQTDGGLCRYNSFTESFSTFNKNRLLSDLRTVSNNSLSIIEIPIIAN